MAVVTDQPSRQVQRAAARQEKKRYRLFSTFLARVWKHLNLPTPTDVQIDVANYLQFGPPKLMVEAFRGVGKSWIAAAFVVWCLYHDPQKKILIVSSGKDFADTMSVFIKRLIDELPECAFLRPRGNQRNSTVQFDVGPALADKSPSVKSVGITGQITGSRADIILSDDVEIPKNSFTAVMRARLADLVKEYAYVIKPETVDGVVLPVEQQPRIIYLGTPQTEMSLYNLLPERGYEIRVWPARVPGNVAHYKGHLAPYIMDMIAAGAKPDTVVDPKRFTNADLLKRMMDVGRTAFQLQYMLDTTLTDSLRFPLKLEDMMVCALDPAKAPIAMAWAKSPEVMLPNLQPVGFSGDYYYRPMWMDATWADYQGSILAIDPSGKGTDETGYAVVKMLHGRLFLVESGGLNGYGPDTMTALAQVAKKHRVNEIIIEDNFGDGMFGALFKPILTTIWPVTITGVHSTGQKELRIIAALEPVLNAHRLVVDEAVITADLEVTEPVYSLMYQLTRLTKDRGALEHDDRLEALAMAVQYWLPQMETDADKAAAQHQEEAMEEMLDQFMDGLEEGMAGIGHNGGPPLADPEPRRKASDTNWSGY